MNRLLANLIVIFAIASYFVWLFAIWYKIVLHICYLSRHIFSVKFRLLLTILVRFDIVHEAHTVVPGVGRFWTIAAKKSRRIRLRFSSLPKIIQLLFYRLSVVNQLDDDTVVFVFGR